MLLRHTPTEVKEREALTINPAKTCQPVGAMYAALGLHGCLPHSHGSQGCCSYHRSTLTRHYKEPVMSATSSFTEGSSVFGGQSNLMQSVQNIFSIYKPDVIAVHTTCLSETIGDDIVQIARKATDDGLVPTGKRIIHCNTPSYVGSHVTGFANMVAGMVKYLSEPAGDLEPSQAWKRERLNVIPGWVEPCDMRELKRMFALMGVKTVLFPDTSDVLDGGQTGKFDMYPSGGTTIEEMRDTGASKMTLALGPTASASGAEALQEKCEVPFELLELPYGLTMTDRLVDAVRRATGKEPPAELLRERQRLVDMIIDYHQYTYNKRVALWGDPDQLVGLSQMLLDFDMRPVYVVTGTPGKQFDRRMAAVLGDRVPESKYRQGPQADMFLMHQWIKNETVDLLLGNTYGKYIARDEDIPFLRHGFPILDRPGHQFFPTVGYTGAIRMLEQILNLVLDRQDRDSSEETFELTM